MQEEITQGAVASCVEATKMSADLLQKAMEKVLEEIEKGKAKAAGPRKGKQTLRQLIKGKECENPPFQSMTKRERGIGSSGAALPLYI